MGRDLVDRTIHSAIDGASGDRLRSEMGAIKYDFAVHNVLGFSLELRQQ